MALRFLVILPAGLWDGVGCEGVGTGSGSVGVGMATSCEGAGVVACVSCETSTWTWLKISVFWLVSGVGVGGRRTGRGGTGGTSWWRTVASSFLAEASLCSRSETRLVSFACFCRSFFEGDL